LEYKVQQRTKEIQQNEEKLNTILDNVDAYIFLKNAQYEYIYANKSVQTLFGKPLPYIIGRTDEAFFDAQTVQNLQKNDAQVIQYGKKVVEEEINTDMNGQLTKAFLSVKLPLRREDGSIYAICGISTDITERKRAEDEIRSLAFYDTLTKLPNRRLLTDRMTQAMALSQRSGQYGALLVLDLDNFKPLNDTYGHSAGDLLLIEAAKRLLACVRDSDTVARFGGDEFVVLLSELSDDKLEAMTKARAVAEKIRFSLSQTYSLIMPTDAGDRVFEHHSAASIGVALFLGREFSQDEIFNRADSAMYAAKENGRNQVCSAN
jgi:diguanylate cyclase (GGDEF)-like protein/PAS domain S-box-containing protein